MEEWAVRSQGGVRRAAGGIHRQTGGGVSLYPYLGGLEHRPDALAREYAAQECTHLENQIKGLTHRGKTEEAACLQKAAAALKKMDWRKDAMTTAGDIYRYIDAFAPFPRRWILTTPACWSAVRRRR